MRGIGSSSFCLLCRNGILAIAALAILAAVPVFAAKANKPERQEMKREAGADSGAKPDKFERQEMKREASAAPAGKITTEENPPSRALSQLREHLEVPDDSEWGVIAQRISQIVELRRALPAANSRLDLASGSKKSRANSSAHPEQDALRAAVVDRLPDAEIKARLARVQEILHQNEAKLARAQQDLRAVLTIRQEAVAVIAGLLPP